MHLQPTHDFDDDNIWLKKNSFHHHPVSSDHVIHVHLTIDHSPSGGRTFHFFIQLRPCQGPVITHLCSHVFQVPSNFAGLSPHAQFQHRLQQRDAVTRCLWCTLRHQVSPSMDPVSVRSSLLQPQTSSCAQSRQQGGLCVAQGSVEYRRLVSFRQNFRHWVKFCVLLLSLNPLSAAAWKVSHILRL